MYIAIRSDGGPSVLTQTEIDRFHTDGFLVLRGLFSEREVGGLVEAAEQVQAEALAGDGDGHLFRDIDGRRQYYRTNGLWDRHAAFRSATVQPQLLAAVGQCLGHPFLPINDAMVVKLPHSGVSIDWHQDPPYKAHNGVSAATATFGVPNFDVDIYLDTADLLTGCLFGIPEHHLVGHVELERFTEQDLFEHPSTKAFKMHPGDVLFHAISAPHGSKPNDGETIRRIFYVHYMAREVLERCYAYLLEPYGWSWANGLVLAARLLSELGYGDGSRMLAENAVELTDAGFLFEGGPKTPPNHWEELISRMTPMEIDRKRRLDTGRLTDVDR